MTARDRLVALRREMAAIVLARAAAVGVAIALVGVTMSHAFALPAALALLLVAIAAGAAVAMRGRGTRSLARVALWVEERHPELRYALVSAAESAVVRPELEVPALRIPWWEQERRRLLAALARPLVFLVAAVALALWRPAVVRTGASTASRAVSTGAARGGAGADPLATIHARVVPPAYAGRSAVELDEPVSVDALVGSSVIISGHGDAGSVRAVLDSSSRDVEVRDDRWTTSFAMPVRPALLRLRSRAGRERLVVLAPMTDAPPAVTLVLPARDTVVRRATGVMVLRATLRDDIGLRDAAFEVIVSSGQAENYTFHSTTLARTGLAGRASGTIDARLSLDSLALQPGDVLQLRAVAHDGNVVTGPGTGSSETRALRVARAGEYDSLAVDAAPPAEVERQVLSQRMLITLTEALDARRPRLERPVLVAEAQRIAADEARLRTRVGDIVFQRLGGEPLSEESTIEGTPGKLTPEELLARARDATRGAAGEVMDVEGDETPILALNKPLLEAFNAMWDAGRALEQGDTRAALPPMRAALAAIQRARQAERIYLRGRPAAVVVDLARARLAGKDTGASLQRPARPATAPAARRRQERFARATTLLAHDPSAAADTLLVMRVDALGDDPALAAALDDAARALRRGDARATTLAWTRLRRALGGAPVRHDSLPLWGGAP